MIREELKLCTVVAERFPKNYYAWTHRLYCIRKAPSLLQEEWNFILGWLPTHVSDHSAVHYGGQVLLLLLQVNNNNRLELVQSAMEEGRRLVTVRPAHEVLWIFRRVCAHATMLLILEENETDDEILASMQEYFVQHVENEWNEAQESRRPKLGSELELEWQKTHVFRLSFIVWLTSNCRLMDERIRRQAIQALRECDFIPYNLWRIEESGLS